MPDEGEQSPPSRRVGVYQRVEWALEEGSIDLLATEGSRRLFLKG